MSTVAPRRDKRKKIKPRLSFGSSSGACSSLPSQQAHADEPHYDANGNATGWSVHKNPQKDDFLMYSESGPDIYSARSSPDSAKLSDGKESVVDSFPVSEDDTGSICVEDVPVDEEPEFEPLTDADVADIIRQLRDFLQENGPSQEDDLLEVLSAQQARQVLSEYSTLANFVDRHPGFRQLHEDLHSFLYYQDPEDDEDDDDYYSTPTVAPAGAHNGLPSSAVCKQVGSGQKPEPPTGADGDGPRGARASSCSSTSYESAVEDEIEEKGTKGVSRKDCSSQTPSRPRCLSRALQAVRLTRDAEAQTHGWDPAQFAELELMLKKRNKEISELQDRLASLQEDHAREVHQLHLEIEKLQNRPPLLALPSLPLPLQNEADQDVNGHHHHPMDEEEGEEEVERSMGAVATITKAVEDFGNGEEQCQLPQARPSPPPLLLLRQKSPPIRAEPPEDAKLHALSIEPRPRPVASSADPKGKRPADRPQVPEFYELHCRMEQAAAPCSDVESMYSSRGGSPTKSKTEQQIMKIVQMVKKQQSNYSEQEIRRHVDHVRHAQGGFSRMTFNAIVALVLGHMKTASAATTHNKHRNKT